MESALMCAFCGAEFSPVRSDQRFCQPRCTQLALDIARGRVLIGPAGFIITCVICDRRRAVAHPSKKACHACTPEYYRRYKKAHRDPKARREYDQQRYVTHRDYYRERYITHRDYYRARNRESQARRTLRDRAARWAKAAVEVERTWLALPPGPSVPETPRRFPASDIKTRPRPRRFTAGLCANCGDAFVICGPGRGDRFCAPKCGKRHGRRRRRYRNSPASDPAVRLAVFEYDDYLCQLCEGPTRPDLTVPHLLAPVIDHIQPRSQGGPDVIENMQTAHFYCNSLKCAMDDEEFRRRYVWPTLR